jgi:hypothetical protein
MFWNRELGELVAVGAPKFWNREVDAVVGAGVPGFWNIETGAAGALALANTELVPLEAACP